MRSPHPSRVFLFPLIALVACGPSQASKDAVGASYGGSELACVAAADAAATDARAQIDACRKAVNVRNGVDAGTYDGTVVK